MGGSGVIAKRSLLPSAIRERTVYQEVLPYLPMPVLRYYGFTRDENPEFAWQFLEDAGDEWYSAAIPEQRVALSRWLGAMHVSATAIPAASRLPDRGPSYYLGELRSARDRILRNLSNLALKPEHKLTLQAIVSQCGTVESHWGKVEELCGAMPRTLVHADFAEKNARIRNVDSGIILFPLDWENAGWAPPAADLESYLDLPTYWSAVHRSWARLRFEDLQQLSNYGRIFRVLEGVHWSSHRLEYEWIEKPTRHLSVYHSYLADAIRAAGWEA